MENNPYLGRKNQYCLDVSSDIINLWLQFMFSQNFNKLPCKYELILNFTDGKDEELPPWSERSLITDIIKLCFITPASVNTTVYTPERGVHKQTNGTKQRPGKHTHTETIDWPSVKDNRNSMGEWSKGLSDAQENEPGCCISHLRD